MKKTALLLPLLLSACFPVVMPAANPMDETPNIYGAWRLRDIGGYAPADPNALLTIHNSDNRFSAFSECGKVSGRYAVAANQALSFHEIRVEGKCADNAAERHMQHNLHAVRAYRFNARHLELLNEQGRVVLAGSRLRSERTENHASGRPLYLQDARRN